MEIIPSTQPGCAVEIIPSHIILYQTFPIFVHKKHKEILILGSTLHSP